MSRILLVEKNTIFRLGLRELVKDLGPVWSVVEAETLTEGCVLLREKRDVALVILDIGAPNCGGLVGLFQIRGEFPDIPVVALSTHLSADQARQIFALGAAGIIGTSMPCDDILQTLSLALSGCTRLVSIPKCAPRFTNPLETLSPALRRVLMGVKRGLRNKEIAFELGLSEMTIKAYLKILYRKIGVSNRTQAVMLLQEALAETQSAAAVGSTEAEL